MKKIFIEAPVCEGSPTRGSEAAFQVLSSCDAVRKLHNVGFAECFVDFLGRYPKKDNIKFPDRVMPVVNSVYRNALAVLRGGDFPIVIGGDHSIAMGTIAADATRYGAENISVIYVDGHTDINTEKTTETGFIHGMPLASAMGLCDRMITCGNRVNLFGKNTFIIGARSIDDGEYGIISENGVHLYTAEECRRRGCKEIIAEVLASITANRIHFSFDVDFLDGTVFPATGYIMPDGMAFSDAKNIFEAIKQDGRFVSADLVEYNPELDVNGSCLKMLATLAKIITD